MVEDHENFFSVLMTSFFYNISVQVVVQYVTLSMIKYGAWIVMVHG